MRGQGAPFGAGAKDAHREVSIERHPALASAESGGRFPPLSGPVETWALGRSLRLDRLPYVLAKAGGEGLCALSLALEGEDLVLLGYDRGSETCSEDVGAALVAEAERIARGTGRQRLIAPVTNADLEALFFLQTQGFGLAEMRPYEGPARAGAGGIAATHELLLVRGIG